MDLSLVPLQELYEELLNRFDHAVFMGKKIYGKDSNISRRWKGDYHIAMGLCDDLNYEIIQNMLETEEPIKTDDL